MAEREMFNHSLIVGKFAPLHKGHQFLIETALQEGTKVTVMVYSNPDFLDMPSYKRAQWIRGLYPHITVLTPRNAPWNLADDYTHREFVKNNINGMGIDVVFTSESYGDGLGAHLGIKHRLVDIDRKHHPVSGTKIREDIHGNRAYIHPLIYKDFVKKVVILGAESTGKSTLVTKLANRFDTNYVAEYGREYYEKNGGHLSLADYVHIAEHHRVLENRLAQTSNKFLFVDTNAVTTLFYSYYYNQGSLPELHKLADQCKDRYDYCLVCADDIPFKQDGWRDNELLRSKMQRMILMDLNNRKIPFTLLSGSIENRVNQVVEFMGE